MITREAIALVRNLLSGGSTSDDSPIPQRRILSELRTFLAVIKRRRILKKQTLGPHDIVTLPCVAMHQADKVDCPNIPSSGLVWLKSDAAIPRFLKLIDVVTLLGNTAIPIVEWGKVRTRSTSRNKALREKPVATFKTVGDEVHLYLLNTKIEACSLVFIPENYLDALLFPKCGEINSEAKCNPLDVEIGADYTSIAEATDMLMGKEARQIPSDELNNDNSVK